MRRILVPCLTAVMCLAALTATPPASGGVATDDPPFPSRIELPDGFQPEGIAIGPGPTAWFGSRADGDIYEVSLRTGEGEVISQGPGTASVGLKSDRGRLFVAGGNAGTARVIDSDSGALVANYQLASAPTFVNDVVLTKRAAWFTDSLRPQLYRIDLGPDGAPGSATTVPLSGEWQQVPGFNANGISTTPTGKALLVVNSTTGVLYRVDPATGAATKVDLGGASLTSGDGMLRHGRLLYVVRNTLNEVAVLRLDRQGSSGERVRELVAADLDPSTSFDVPTTVARFGNRLYLPNARFGVANPTTEDYWITQVRARP